MATKKTAAKATPTTTPGPVASTDDKPLKPTLFEKLAKTVRGPGGKDALTSDDVKALAKSAPSPLGVSVPGGDFLTEKKSPFADGYSIAKESAFLAEYIAKGADEDDPLYERYIELDDRKTQLELSNEAASKRNHAEAGVGLTAAQSLDQLGALIDIEPDLMSIHTKEAHRLFMGRQSNLSKKIAPLPGGRRNAAVLKSLWLLTRNDNPYADWALIRHEQTIEQIRKQMDKEIAEAEALIKKELNRGLQFSVMVSRAPSVMRLGFRSPYGYAVAKLIVAFDYFVRMQYTLSKKDVITDTKRRSSINAVTTAVRRMFNETSHFERWLVQDQIRNLAREDFFPGVGAEADARVEFAVGVFQMVPSEVYTGQIQPSHSLRYSRLTQQERNLLVTVAESWSDGKKAAALAQKLSSQELTYGSDGSVGPVNKQDVEPSSPSGAPHNAATGGESLIGDADRDVTSDTPASMY